MQTVEELEQRRAEALGRIEVLRAKRGDLLAPYRTGGWQPREVVREVGALDAEIAREKALVRDLTRAIADRDGFEVAVIKPVRRRA